MSEPRAIFGDDGNSIHEGYATCYAFSSETGEFLDEFESYVVIGTGIPGSSTLSEPEEKKDGFAMIFDGNSWIKKEDHRGETVYKKSSGEPHEVYLIGEISDEYTILKPETEYDVFDGEKWVTDLGKKKSADISSAELKKSSIIKDINERTQNLQVQLMLGIISDEDKDYLTSWMKYYQTVKAVDTSTAPEISWPDEPK